MSLSMRTVSAPASREMSWMNFEDCQVRWMRMVLRTGPLSVIAMELTAVMGVIVPSRGPGAMFQASYCLGVSLKVWGWLAQGLGARYEAPLFSLWGEVMEPSFFLISGMT